MKGNILLTLFFFCQEMAKKPHSKSSKSKCGNVAQASATFRLLFLSVVVKVSVDLQLSFTCNELVGTSARSAEKKNKTQE